MEMPRIRCNTYCIDRKNMLCLYHDNGRTVWTNSWSTGGVGWVLGSMFWTSICSNHAQLLGFRGRGLQWGGWLHHVSNSWCTEPIFWEEVTDWLFELPPRKAIGPDGDSNYALLRLHKQGVRLLVALFNVCLLFSKEMEENYGHHNPKAGQDPFRADGLRW